MSNAFATAIFLARNSGKVQSGDVARTPVVVAQTGSLIKKVTDLDNTIRKGVIVDKAADVGDVIANGSKAVDAFEKGSKVTSFGSKAINAAGDLVNPLLVAAAAYRVGTADEKDRESVLYKETGGMGTMFAAEHIMKKESVNNFVKKNGDEVIEMGIDKLAKVIKPLEKLAPKSKSKVIKIGSFILAGAAMVGASIMGYSEGADIGTKLYAQKRRLFNNPESTQKEVKTVETLAKTNDSNKENFFIES